MAVRRKADTILANSAWNGVRAKDYSWGEKAAALSVASAMKLNSKLGLGIVKKKV